jgi:putative N6-adenine-specific DNA methylase
MPTFDQSGVMLLACSRGISPYLAEEARRLGMTVRDELDSGIETEGTLADAMRLNLHLRTANRVLFQVGAFRALDATHLYRHVRRLAWEAHLPADGYFTVTSFVRNASIRDARFANVRCKDAIADRMRERCGRRPDSGNERRAAVVFLYWNERDCRIYLDTSGESLSRRGYRRFPLEAPMQETLAAAVLMAAGWKGDVPFVNPMCGSGTLAIEAALMAAGRAPGLQRENFGFMHLAGFDRRAWKRLRDEARPSGAPAPAGPPVRLVATDIRPEAIDAARRNARLAGVEAMIDFSACDFADTPVPPSPGVVVLNPEYGERMGAAAELEAVYGRIGDFLKQKCQGCRGYVFTGNLPLSRRIGLHSRRRIVFFNGPIECRLLEFELYAGTRRP